MNKDLLLDGYVSCAVNIIKQAELDYLELQTAEFPEHNPSDKYLKKEHRLFNKAAAKGNWVAKYNPFKRFAACVVIGLALVTCTFAPVQAVQRAIVETVVEWHDIFTTFIFKDHNISKNDFPNKIILDYIPKSYNTIILNESSNSKFTFVAANDNGNELIVSIETIEDNYSLSVDNEHYSFYPIKFDEKDAFMGISRTGETVLLWKEHNMVFNISATESINELVRIAENINY